MKKSIFPFFFLLIIIFISSCGSNNEQKKVITLEQEEQIIQAKPGESFQVRENAEICTEDGKPIIRLFATTWCPHCKWIKETYIGVVEEYMAKGEIVAYLWNADVGDNVLTEKTEKQLPREENVIFQEFNPQQSIPTYVFGCKYHRIGNAFEGRSASQETLLAAEAKEFRFIIDKVIAEAKEQTAQ